MSHPNPPTSPQFFEETFQRIQTVTGIRTQQALANLLEISQSSIADAKRRGSIPEVFREEFRDVIETLPLGPVGAKAYHAMFDIWLDEYNDRAKKKE